MLNDLGRFSSFSINSSSLHFLQGSAFVEPKDPPSVVAHKRARARIAKYSSALAVLTPRDFEVLCGRLLSLLGVEHVTTTPYSADEGIDFYGLVGTEKLIEHDPAFPKFVRQVSVWLLGQAKHYTKTNVATPDLRDLVGSVALARSRAFGSLGPKYEDLKIRVCDPVFFLFFTTGTLTAAAWRLAAKSGMIALDGGMIADFLAGREIGVVDGSYSDAKFTAWLSEERED